jgi:hypothetical protein
MDFGLVDEQAAEFYVGTGSRDTTVASGTQSITGVGFQPKAIIGNASVSGTEKFSVCGISDGTSNRNIQPQNQISFQDWSNQPYLFSMIQAGSTEYHGEIQSFDSDGFTITWTKTGSTTGTLNYQFMCLR